MNLPASYLETMKNMLGNEFDAYLESFNDSRLYGLRINTLKITTQEFLKISPFKLEPIPWIENGFYFSETDQPAKHPYYFAGLYYIQEPSAMTPANILPIDEEDTVFDMCAAPGGKSTELGAKLNRTGLLVANDISNSRAKSLLKNIELAGIPNVFVLSEDPQKLVKDYRGYFNKVLIDAPCSGEGMFRKDNKLIKTWESNGPEFYHEIQKELIVIGADMLKPGGMMAYSTCTFSGLEDEESIRVLLKSRPEMELVTIKNYEGFSHGLIENEADSQMHLEKTVRIWPHKMQGEGHFIALLRKSISSQDIFHQGNRLPKTQLPSELEEFLKAVSYPIDRDNIDINDNRVLLVPSCAEVHKGYRTLRSGLLLGECKKNRFEPSQAFAMALRKEEYAGCIDLPVHDSRVIKYLKGETIEVDEVEITSRCAYQLICVDGYPLGWGKLNGTTLKNKYIAEWRWM